MSTTTGIPINQLPVLGAVTDDSYVVGEHAGSGLFSALALRSYNAAGGGRSFVQNGLYNIQQRGAGPFNANNALTLDRWRMNFTLDAMTVQPVALGDAQRTAIGDESAVWGLNVNVTGNAGATAFSTVAQAIEGVRRLSGKTVTVSFWAYIVSGTAKLGVTVQQSFGTGGSPSGQVSVTGQATPNLTATPTRYSFTFSVPSAAGMTLGTNGDDATRLAFFFSSGANNNTFAGGIGVQTGNFVIWGCQLEVGSTATQLERPDPQQDFAKCQRFFQAVTVYSQGYGTTGNTISVSVMLPVPMRAMPTLAATGTTDTNLGGAANNAGGASYVSSTGIITATGQYTMIRAFTASADL